jgi:hypothetical protein
VGSVVLEQLLRVCPTVRRIYVIIREKRGQSGMAALCNHKPIMNFTLVVAGRNEYGLVRLLDDCCIDYVHKPRKFAVTVAIIMHLQLMLRALVIVPR